MRVCHGLWPLLLTLCAPAVSAQAFYTWKDDKGVIHFSETAPASGRNPVRQIKDLGPALKDLSPPPPPAPPLRALPGPAAPLIDLGVYAAIDRHAVDAPEDVAASVEQLAAYLVRPAQTQTERARALFRWISHHVVYDWEAFRRGRPSAADPEQVLRQRRAVCEGYSHLFQALAQAAGLEAEVIEGHAKGYGIEPGDALTAETGRHSWNAVKLDGEWRLLDPTWGAGQVDERGFVARFEPYYFLTPPEQFIYQHRPDAESWQLLPRPLSLAEYAKLPLLQPAFFDLGLKLVSHIQGLIVADQSLVVTLEAPDSVLLMGELHRVTGEDLEPGHSFSQYSSLRGEREVLVALPAPGRYLLQLYARPAQDTLYKQVARYAVEAGQGEPGDFPQAYPRFQERRGNLQRPMQATLTAGTVQEFLLRLSATEAVSVVNGDRRVALERSRDLFSGQLRLQPGPVEVVVPNPEGGEQTLLRYLSQ